MSWKIEFIGTFKMSGMTFEARKTFTWCHVVIRHIELRNHSRPIVISQPLYTPPDDCSANAEAEAEPA
jgi:hypothetical protein